jgi:hypothetical protein
MGGKCDPGDQGGQGGRIAPVQGQIVHLGGADDLLQGSGREVDLGGLRAHGDSLGGAARLENDVGGERLLHYVPEEGNRPFAGSKDFVPNQEVELGANHFCRQLNSCTVFYFNHGSSSDRDFSIPGLLRNLGSDCVRNQGSCRQTFP